MDPLRNYARTHRDAAPTQELIEMMKEYFKKREHEADEEADAVGKQK